MPRELPEYRDVLEDLIKRFGDKAFITLGEIAEYDGVCTKTARKRYHIPKGEYGLNRCVLARRMCHNAQEG